MADQQCIILPYLQTSGIHNFLFTHNNLDNLVNLKKLPTKGKGTDKAYTRLQKVIGKTFIQDCQDSLNTGEPVCFLVGQPAE